MSPLKSKAEASVQALAEAMDNLHGCKAVWVESVAVKETFQGDTVWEGEVQVFSLSGHSTAPKCYAWSFVMDKESGKRKFYAVLHQGAVNSPHAAVRAAIVAEHRQEAKL